MIRNLLSVLVVLSMSLWVSPVNALLTFSNVSYTANSVTFTVDGDMSGYTPSSNGNPRQFSIVYGGDIWVGDDDFEPNAWNRPVFDNKSFNTGGNTGTSGNSYTWSEYSNDLNDAVVSNATITVTLTESDLNPAASLAEMSFVWGNGSNAENFTLLDTVVVNSTPPVPVPTLSQWALITLSVLLGFMVFTNRKRLF